MNAEQLKLGQIITAEQQRDAVHVAVAPVTAAHSLSPGDHVGFLSDGKAGDTVSDSSGTPIGIVDPFLKERVKTGQKFWLFLYPGSITSLRHDWTHSAFMARKPTDTTRPVPPPLATTQMDESVSWLTAFGDRNDMSYPAVIQAAKDYLYRGDYINKGNDQGFEDCGDEFWDHFQHATGILVGDDKRGTFFSCSC